MIVSKRHDTAEHTARPHAKSALYGTLQHHARALGLSASVAVLMLCASQSGAVAQSVLGGGGNWLTAGDWTPNGVPTGATDVTVAINGQLTGVGNANNLTISVNSATLTVTNTATLTVNGTLTLNSGNLTNNGTITAGSFTDAGFNQTITNTGQITFLNPVLFDDTIIQNNTGGVFIAPTITVTGTTFNNAAGATVQGNMVLNSAALQGIINNSGTITGNVTLNNNSVLSSNQAGSIITGNLTVNNTATANLRNQVNGSVTVSGGTVNFINTTNGITTITANAGQLNVNAGTVTVTGNVAFGGATGSIQNAVLQANSITQTAGTVNISGANGRISTTGSYTLSGAGTTLNSQGNLIVGTQLLIGAGSVVNNNDFLSVGTNLTNNGTLNNDPLANNTGIIAGQVINNGTLTNFAGGLIGGGLINNAGTATNNGSISNGVVVNGGTLNSNTGASVINGGLTNSATANVRGQVNGTIQNNAAGTLNVVGATTGTGALTNAGTMAAGNNSFTGLTSVTNSGVITGSSGIRAATWNNTGNISGNTFGINTNGPTTITNNGTIGGTTGSINFTANGNTLNITPLSVFNGAIFFNNTTGNTLNFGSGSYTLPVNAYRIVGNAINVSPAQTVITTGLSGAGTGNIVIGSQTAAPTINVINGTSLTNTTASQAREYTQIVSEMIGDVLTLDNEIFDTRQRSNRLRTASTAGEQANAALSGTVNDEFAGRSNIQAAYPAADLFNSQPQFRPSQGVSVDGKGNMFWSRAFSGYRQTPAANGLPTIAAYYAGMSMGYDRRIEDYRVGAFAGYGATGLSNLDNSGNVKGDVFFGGVYARREMGRINVDGTLSGGLISNRSTRIVNGGAQNAIGNFNGWMISPELAVGYRYDLASGWAVTPTLRARYVGAFYNGFTETGSPQNVTYGNQAVHVIEERAEVRVTNTQRSDFGAVTQYYAQAAIFGTHRLGNDTLAANFAGVDFVVTNTATRDLFGASLGLGLDWKMSANVAFYASGDGKYYTNGTVAAAARSGIKVNF